MWKRVFQSRTRPASPFPLDPRVRRLPPVQFFLRTKRRTPDRASREARLPTLRIGSAVFPEAQSRTDPAMPPKRQDKHFGLLCKGRLHFAFKCLRGTCFTVLTDA